MDSHGLGAGWLTLEPWHFIYTKFLFEDLSVYAMQIIHGKKDLDER